MFQERKMVDSSNVLSEIGEVNKEIHLPQDFTRSGKIRVSCDAEKYHRILGSRYHASSVVAGLIKGICNLDGSEECEIMV